MSHQEIEVRFLKTTPQQLATKLKKLHATDRGEMLLEEVTFMIGNISGGTNTSTFVFVGPAIQ